MVRGQAERLFGVLEEVLGEGSCGWTDLDAVAVATGPGNFTGIRISVAAARGLALSLDRPAIGVSLFEAVALGGPAPALVVLAAPRAQVYAAVAPGLENPALFETIETAHAGFADLPLILGEGLAHSTAPALAPAHALLDAIALIAEGRLADAPPSPVPFYLRAPDAAPSRHPAPLRR